jgi:ABC-2 type transport system ATP-binding protein
MPAEPLGVNPSVLVQNVSKWFGQVVAVSDVTFAVYPGVTALLGPNGAGKSTMLRMLSGQESVGAGTVAVLGQDPRASRDVARNIGIVPQQEKLFDDQSALEFVSFNARLQEVDDAEAMSRHALDAVELDPDSPRPIATYSKGMRQRVKVAQAIVYNPHLLLLDEPLTGLDPRQRLHMVSLFKRLGERGHCVIVSSHVLDEVARLGSRVLVIAQGRLAAQGDFHEIRALMDNRPHRMKVRSDRPRELAGALLASGCVNGVDVVDHETVTATTPDVAAFRRNVAVLAKDNHARLREVKPLDDDLESVFRYLVGR